MPKVYFTLKCPRTKRSILPWSVKCSLKKKKKRGLFHPEMPTNKKVYSTQECQIWPWKKDYSTQECQIWPWKKVYFTLPKVYFTLKCPRTKRSILPWNVKCSLKKKQKTKNWVSGSLYQHGKILSADTPQKLTAPKRSLLRAPPFVQFHFIYF